MIMERMAHELSLPGRFIERIARSASYEYKHYQIPKRQGGFRDIYHPSKRLKPLQRWLLANVIRLLPVHDTASAYREGRSILDNAKSHSGSKYLLRMDFTNFFPSINVADIARYIADHPPHFGDWKPQDVETFCSLVCRNNCLTIGAPTSPGLSNALCYELDLSIASFCLKKSVSYTRYADELFFSTNYPDVLSVIESKVYEIVKDTKLPANLTINSAKTRHSSKKGARRVTGIVLGSDGKTHVGRPLKRKIRALIHRYPTLNAREQASLSGLIAYVIGFDPDFMNSLIAKYGPDLVLQAKRMPYTVSSH